MIIFIDHSESSSGGQVSLKNNLLNYKCNFKEIDIKIILNKNNSELIKFLKKHNFDYITYDFSEFFLVKFLKLFIYIKKQKKFKKKIILYGNTFEGGVWSGMVGSLLFIPSIFRVRLSPKIFNHGFVDWFIFSLNDQILCNSKFIKNECNLRFRSFFNKKLHVNYSPLQNMLPIKNALTNKNLNIAVVGRFEPIKEQLLILESLNKISYERIKNIKFYFYGNKDNRYLDYFKKFESTLNASHFKKNISVLYNVTDIEKIYKNIHVVLVGSKVEALSRVLIECSLYGCLPVAFNGASNPELIQNKINGFLFNNYDEMNDILIYLSLNIHKLEYMTSNYQQDINKTFSLENTTFKEIQIIQDLM